MTFYCNLPLFTQTKETEEFKPSIAPELQTNYVVLTSMTENTPPHALSLNLEDDEALESSKVILEDNELLYLLCTTRLVVFF